MSGCFDVDLRGTTAKSERARLDLKNFEAALELYHLKKGAWPTREEGLEAVQRAGILVELPRDPWGAAYSFDVVDGVPVVRTLGADGAVGGTGPNADLTTALAARAAASR